jgi:hypothetical protein
LLKAPQTVLQPDADGKFSIEVPSQRSVLVFSMVDHSDKEETVGSRLVIDVTLTESASNLEGVVVVGYGSQKRRDVTGAISSIPAKKIAERAPQNVFEAIQGQVPGVVVAQESGRPGASSSIRIRGIGTIEGGAEPLYVVDGAQGVNIDGINPADIESIEILRDAASAAIYGSAGWQWSYNYYNKKRKRRKAKDRSEVFYKLWKFIA